MTNYRQTMAEVLEFMNIMREYRILERDLTDTEKKRREEIAQDMDDGDFKSRYGDRWKEVKMAVATKQAKKEDGDGPLSTVDEATKYDIYHKTFSDAMQHSYKAAKKMYGITVDPNEIDQKVASGPKKPSAGKTNRYQLKGDKGTIQVQVANLDNKRYELNMYKEDVDLNEDNMDLMRKAADGAMQTIKFKDGKQKMDSFSASGIMQVYDKVNAKNKKAMEMIINKGTVAQMLKLQSFAMKQVKSGDEFDHDGEDLEEKFTMKDFKSNEDGNDHTQNAVELVKMFGDNYEKRQVAQIQKDHDKNRSISAKDQKVRDALIKKYLPQLEEDLDEKVRYSAPTKDGKNTFQVIDRDTKGMRGKQDDYKMVIVDKKGKVVKDWGSHISVDGAVMMAKNKKIIEDVELDEGSNSDVIVMKKGRVGKSVLPDAREIKKLEKEGWKIEGVIEKGSKILHKDPKRIMKAIKGGDKLGIGESLEEGKMKELHMYIQQKKSAEWIAKKMGLDVKTVKELMPEETVLERVSRFLESARSDAMKAMRKSGEFKDKDDDDVTASDDDVKAASKNIIAQMRKVVSLRGKFKVEFQDGKKEKIDPKIAQAVQQKYNSMRRPADKEKFQSQISKSKKDLLNALHESLQEADPPSKAAAASAEIAKKKKIAQDKAKTVAIAKAKAKKGEAEKNKKAAAADAVQNKLDVKQSAEKDKKTMQQAKGADQASATQAKIAGEKEAQKKARDAKIAQAKAKTDADAEKREKERGAQQHKTQMAASYNPILSRIDEKIQERKNG